MLALWKKKGHTKDQCFQLVGYPEWFKDKQRGKNNWQGKGRVSIAHADSGGNSTQQVPQVQVQAPGTTPIQPGAHGQKLFWFESSNGRTQGETGQHSSQVGSQAVGLHMASLDGSTMPTLGTSGTITNQGIFYAICNFSKAEEWVLDSGATDYMTYSEKDLMNFKKPGKMVF
jgi:hypothetical protein